MFLCNTDVSAVPEFNITRTPTHGYSSNFFWNTDGAACETGRLQGGSQQLEGLGQVPVSSIETD